MNILITGGTGFVGNHFKRYFPKATFIGSEINLTDPVLTKQFFSANSFDLVIHLAGKVGGIVENTKYPVQYLEENILINTNCLKASFDSGVKKFIGILSTCAYPDNVPNYPMIEEDLHKGPPTLTNFGYGYSKRILAAQIEAYNKQYGMEYSYILPCNLYGEFDQNVGDKAHFVTSLLYKLKNSKNHRVELLGDGTAIRQFMYADDLARAVHLLVNNNDSNNYNIATPEIKAIVDIAVIACSVTGKSFYTLKFNGKHTGQYRKDVSSAKFLKSYPDFEFTTLARGLKKTYFYDKTC